MEVQNAPINISFLRLSSLGDVIVGACVLPFVRAYLQRQYPQGVRLHWVVDDMFAAVLADSPCIDNLVRIPLKKGGIKAIPRIMRMLQSLESCEKLIDLQGLIKSALCGSFIQKGQFWGFAKDSIIEPVASICYTHKVHIPYNEHILKRNLSLVNAALGIDEVDESIFYANRSCAFGFTQGAQTQIEDILRESCVGSSQMKRDKASYILLVLESSLESKTYPLDLFVEVIDGLLDLKPHIHILLLQHSTDKAGRIKERFATQARVVALPPLSIDLLKALMTKVALVIGGDTGVTHLAWAMQKASLTLYGNTAPERFALNSLINRFLCGSERASYKKDDFCIANIAPSSICASVKDILDSISEDSK